jgi:hypothetical protein
MQPISQLPLGAHMPPAQQLMVPTSAFDITIRRAIFFLQDLRQLDLGQSAVALLAGLGLLLPVDLSIAVTHYQGIFKEVMHYEEPVVLLHEECD